MSAKEALRERGPAVDEIAALRIEMAQLHDELRAGRLPGLALSIEDTCAALGCKRRRVFQLLRSGALERAQRTGRELRITRASIERRLQPEAPKGRKRRRAPLPFEPARLQDIPVFER